MIFERIKKIRNTVEMNQSDFAKSLGMGQSTLAMLEVGKREILDRHIKTICSIYNVDEHWLRTGEGEMFMKPATFSFDEQVKKSNLTELEIAIMRGYMELDADVRKAIMDKATSIITAHTTPVKNEADEIEAEVAAYRAELEAEKKETTLSASDEVNKKSS